MANDLQKQIVYRDPSAIAAAESARARIEAAYIVAMNNKRDVDQARDRILHACKRPIFADRVQFAVLRGKKYDKATGKWVDNIVHGPSIRFAELALREWGNIISDIQVLYEDDLVRRVRVMMLDLETNTSFSKEIQVIKTVERKKAEDRDIMGERTNSQGQKVYIVRATDDEIYNKEAAMISKVLRNEGLRLIPSDIVDEAIEVARKTLSDRDKQDPDAAKKKVLDAFSEIGVKPRDLQQYLGHPTDTLNPKELEDLRSIYRAIKDGEARWADYIETDEDAPKEKKTADPGLYAAKNGIDSGKPPSPPPTDEKAVFRAEWINLKSKGFATYVQSPNNYKMIESMGQKYPDLYQEMKDKWASLYPNHPWPLVEQAPENAPEGGKKGVKPTDFGITPPANPQALYMGWRNLPRK